MSRHVLVARDRLVTFDFEHAYQPGYPVAVALAFELASTVRSLWVASGSRSRTCASFVDAYPEPEILAQSCRLFGSPSLGLAALPLVRAPPARLALEERRRCGGSRR